MLADVRKSRSKLWCVCGSLYAAPERFAVCKIRVPLPYTHLHRIRILIWEEREDYEDSAVDDVLSLT